MHIECVERCTMTVFLDCHENAFRYFGGVPSEVLYDNMKNVVVRRHVGAAKFNSTFMDFAAHAGFKPVACPPYSPWYKGKVERPCLGALPNRPYDTSEKVTRKVYKDCQVSFGGNRYVVPHQLAGRIVLLRVKNGTLGVYNDDTHCVEYLIPESKGNLVAHPRLYEELKRDREQLRRKYRVPAGKAKATRGLLKHGLIHETVQRRPLSVYDAILGVAHV